MRIVSTVFVLLLCASPASAEVLSGHPRVVDADTLAFGKERVRIEGIDAPERHQKCLDAKGEVYPVRAGSNRSSKG